MPKKTKKDKVDKTLKWEDGVPASAEGGVKAIEGEGVIAPKAPEDMKHEGVPVSG